MELRGRSWWAAVGALTLIGCALRIWAAVDESIFLDEVSLNWLVAGRPFGAMVDQVRAVENTPILAFALPWLSSRIGSAPEWIRLPSLIAGTATIPATATLARRAIGHWTGLAAAAFVAVSPFLNFFSVEARPYALACVFVTLSALVLLHACDGDAPRWAWPAWAALVACALLSHYTAVFAIAGEVAWALLFRSTARRPVAMSLAGAAAIFCAAWLGPFLDQLGHSDQQVQFMKFLAPVTVGQFARISATAVAGRPIVPLGEVPGPVLGAVLTVMVGIALAVFAVAVLRLGKGTRRLTLDGAVRSDAGLVLFVAAVPPACLVLASLASGGSFMLARNAIGAVPCALILVAAGFSQLGRKAKEAAAFTLTATLLTATVLGTLDWPRPRMRAAADAITSHWERGDVVVEESYSQAQLNDGDLAPYLPSRVADSIVIARIPRPAEARTAFETAFARARKAAGSVFVLSPLTDTHAHADGPPTVADSHDFRRNGPPRVFDGAGRLMLVEWTPRPTSAGR